MLSPSPAQPFVLVVHPTLQSSPTRAFTRASLGIAEVSYLLDPDLCDSSGNARHPVEVSCLSLQASKILGNGTLRVIVRTPDFAPTQGTIAQDFARLRA